MVMVYQAAAIWRAVLQLIPDPCLASRLVSGMDTVGLYDLESPSCWGLCQARQQLAFKLLSASRHRVRAAGLARPGHLTAILQQLRVSLLPSDAEIGTVPAVGRCKDLDVVM